MKIQKILNNGYNNLVEAKDEGITLLDSKLH